MADVIPTSGPWQTDPQLLQLIQAARSPSYATPLNKTGVTPEAVQLSQYVNANRQRLGIPEGYRPDASTGGQTLVKDEGVPWLKESLIGGGLLLGGVGLPAWLGSGGSAAADAAAAGSEAPALGNVNGTLDALASGGAGASALSKLLSGKGLASLAPIVAALAARGGNGASGIDTSALARQQQITETQMRRADPLHQAVTQLAYSRLPVSARQGTTFNVLPLPQ